MNKFPQFKRGDYFQINIVLQDENMDYINGAELNIKSQIRTSDNLLMSDLVVSQIDEFGLYSLTSEDTQNWQTGDLYMDIEFNLDRISSTETFIIPVVKDVTYND